jgi:hypothetical protein
MKYDEQGKNDFSSSRPWSDQAKLLKCNNKHLNNAEYWGLEVAF